MTRIVQVRLYQLLVALVVALVSPVLAIFASVQIAERNLGRAIKAQTVRECADAALYVRVYDTTPPTTDAGRALQRAYQGKINSDRCRSEE